MRRVLTMPVFVAGLAGVLASCTSTAQQNPPATPFKLGTFGQGTRVFVGLVLRDALVVDIAAANAAFQQQGTGHAMTIPADMKGVIEAYDAGLGPRLRALAATAASASTRPAYVHEIKTLTAKPPIMYPQTILNAAVNYVEHAREMSGRGAAAPASSPPPPTSAAGLWQRRPDDKRHNPYLFQKPSAVVIADAEAIRMPVGREQVDWECELAIVVAKRAKHVRLEQANDYIFGYTLQNDVSDRGGRGDTRHGSDWLIGKGHDTFAPMGPLIVPREFVPNPQKLAIKFTLSDRVMQDSTTANMTHAPHELLHFASNILTLVPGDIVSTGSPAGVGAGRETPVFMKGGDLSVCTIESIGTLTNPVIAAAPTDTTAR
jgi:2-keto-4-pentenoate hydratase/2-oxohepta-3-ene-1,7-dioic acid hydratase in catechol pathway